jgi:NAD(P)-dependent dehydrogenase (short-subunit alcohol dehydrogenase family)
MGGEAFANGADVANWAQTKLLVDETVATFGRLDVVVNNAGFVRDRMFVSCSEEEWDAVVNVHLKGHFCLSRHAAAYWRDQVKAGNKVDARIINTSSGAGVLGSVGQCAYSAAKAGIATLTLVQGAELALRGDRQRHLPHRAHAHDRGRLRRRHEGPRRGLRRERPGQRVALRGVAGQQRERDVTGRVWEVVGGQITAFDGYRREATVDAGKRWDPREIGAAVKKVLADSQPLVKVYGA